MIRCSKDCIDFGKSCKLRDRHNLCNLTHEDFKKKIESSKEKLNQQNEDEGWEDVNENTPLEDEGGTLEEIKSTETTAVVDNE